MLNIFEYTDYRGFLTSFGKNLPKKGRGWGVSLGEFLNITPVIVSQVLCGHRNFSEEQGVELTEFLSLTESESEYFMTLLKFQRAGSAKLKRYYNKKVKAQLLKSKEIKSRLKEKTEFTEEAKAKYYSEWHYGAVRLFAALENQSGLEMLTQRLGIPKATALNVIEFLIQHGLLEQNKLGEISGTKASTHIPRESALVNRHHKNWRLKAFEQMPLKHEDDLFFTSPMVISNQLYLDLHKDILTFINNQSKKISQAKCEELVLLNIDLCKF